MPGHFVHTRRWRSCVGANIITVLKSYRYERTLIEPRRLNNSHKPDLRFIRRFSFSIPRTRRIKMKKPLFSFTPPYKDDYARNYRRMLRLILSLFSGSHRDPNFPSDLNECNRETTDYHASFLLSGQSKSFRNFKLRNTCNG